VAYFFSDPWKAKLDTVSLSFDLNVSIAKTITVAATIDSGKTWIDISNITSNGSNGKVVRWAPKNSQTLPKYFGIKHCFIRISDLSTGKFIDTDTFPLIGSIPMIMLNSPTEKSYKGTDSIKVQFGVNADLTSNIETHFKTDSTNWVQFKNDSNLPSPDAPTIKNFQKVLIPALVDSMVKVEAKNFSIPIMILLKDYSPIPYVITTGYITILPE
jgi:hypothetical protein